MKIAFFTDTYEPQINGVVFSINSFAASLKKNGHHVSIYAPSCGKKSSSVVHVPSIPFFPYPGYRIGVPFSTHLLQKNTDIIHVHTPFSLGLAGITIGKLLGKPVVGSFHTLIPEFTDYVVKTKRFKPALKHVTWRYLRWFYNQCDLVIAPTPEIKAVLKKQGVQRPITVIPTGVERPPRIEKSAARKKHHFSYDEKIILHVGRISQEKNIPFLLRALRPLLHDNTKFVITSDGPYKKELENVAQQYHIPNVIFTGFLTRRKLDEFYALADIFVVASKSETQGLTVADAAMHGLPIVALETPVIGNFIRRTKTGFVVSEKQFCVAVHNVLQKNIHVKLPAGYTIQETTRQLIAAYEDVLSSMSAETRD
ncbi:MAG: glycosyltransferase [Candidatus Aenigmarchaeota archaeon]|nr:glycosyltransferase [Candidatus Aenigmarchaeota archaeon]